MRNQQSVSNRERNFPWVLYQVNELINIKKMEYSCLNIKNNLQLLFLAFILSLTLIDLSPIDHKQRLNLKSIPKTGRNCKTNSWLSLSPKSYLCQFFGFILTRVRHQLYPMKSRSWKNSFWSLSKRQNPLKFLKPKTYEKVFVLTKWFIYKTNNIWHVIYNWQHHHQNLIRSKSILLNKVIISVLPIYAFCELITTSCILNLQNKFAENKHNMVLGFWIFLMYL